MLPPLSASIRRRIEDSRADEDLSSQGQMSMTTLLRS